MRSEMCLVPASNRNKKKKLNFKKLLNKDLNLEDIKLTKEVIVRNSNGKQYEVFDKKDYEEIADLVVYILKAVE